METPSPDAARCPLCGGPNACEMAAAAAEGREAGRCWCLEELFPPDLLERLPEASRGRRCICRACVRAARPGHSG